MSNRINKMNTKKIISPGTLKNGQPNETGKVNLWVRVRVRLRVTVTVRYLVVHSRVTVIWLSNLISSW